MGRASRRWNSRRLARLTEAEARRWVSRLASDRETPEQAARAVGLTAEPPDAAPPQQQFELGSSGILMKPPVELCMASSGQGGATRHGTAHLRSG